MPKKIDWTFIRDTFISSERDLTYSEVACAGSGQTQSDWECLGKYAKLHCKSTLSQAFDEVYLLSVTGKLNMLIRCKNCGKQKKAKARQCHHCKKEFFPCRKCKTLLLIERHRFFQVVKPAERDIVAHDFISNTTDNEIVVEQDFVDVVNHAQGYISNRSCPNCGDKEPLKRFANTFLGGVIVNLIKKALPIVYLLVTGFSLICVIGSDLLPFITHLSISKNWTPYLDKHPTFLGGTLLFFIIFYLIYLSILGLLSTLFPDACGVNPKLATSIGWDMKQYKHKQGKEILGRSRE